MTHEIGFVMGMLQYAQERIMASAAVSRTCRNLQDDASLPDRAGCFLNLQCGHNNAMNKAEKERLTELLQMAETLDPQ